MPGKLGQIMSFFQNKRKKNNGNFDKNSPSASVDILSNSSNETQGGTELGAAMPTLEPSKSSTSTSTSAPSTLVSSPNTMHYLSELPNELWLMVLSYLDIVDIFRAFHQLNQRFNNLIYDSARHISLPSDITNDWLQKHIPHLENRIKIICLNEKSVQYVFENAWSFPNLRLINLQGVKWNMSLRINQIPVSIILISSIQFLNNVDIYDVKMSSYYYRKNIIIDNYNKTSSCPFIERLSIEIYSMRSLSVIYTCAPNLIHLKINCISMDRYESSFINELSPVGITTNLITLKFTAEDLRNLNVLEQLINNYNTSLKKIVLNIHCFESVDGYHLESILKSCKQLKNISFFFISNTININDCLHSFQSGWWLDIHRPVIYIQPDVKDGTIIASMPFYRSFIFKNGLYNWYINKGDQNSSFIRFNNDIIHFTNKIHQSISLKYLDFIHHTFTSSNQCLYFDFCNLETVDFLFDMLMDGMKPILFKIKHFIVGSQNTLDSLMLCVWILLMPNLETLDISKLTSFNQLELAKELKDMIDKEQRLKPTFEHIKELIIFSNSNNFDNKTKNELSIAFRKVFIHQNIS